MNIIPYTVTACIGTGALSTACLSVSVGFPNPPRVLSVGSLLSTVQGVSKGCCVHKHNVMFAL